MQGSAFRRGDQIGGSAGAGGLGDFHVGGYSKSGADMAHRGRCLGHLHRAEIAASAGNAKALDALVQQRGRGFGGAGGTERVLGVVALHRVVGQCQIPDRTRQRAEVVQAGHEREAAGARQASEGRFQAEQPAQR